MKYNFKYFMVFVFMCTNLIAAFEKREAGAREQSLGNAVVAMNNSPFVVLYNPANIQPASFNIFTSYRNYYGIPGIYQADIAANVNLLNIGSSFAISKYGNDIYSETEINTGGSYTITDEFSIGISLKGYFLSIKNYGDTQSMGINLGVSYRYFDELNIGAFVTNINNPEIGTTNEELPQTFSLGFEYQLMQQANLYFELFRDVKHKQDYRAGFEYEPLNNLFIRAGLMDNSDTYSFGLGSSIDFLMFDYALVNHSILGVSHVITLGAVL